MDKIAELMKARAKAFDGLQVLANLDRLDDAQKAEFKKFEIEIADHDEQIKIKKSAQAILATKAEPVGAATVHASADNDAYKKDASLIVAGMMKLCASSKGIHSIAMQESATLYGERHPVTDALGMSKNLAMSSGSGGGFVVPPSYVAEVIKFLYAAAVVRRAGPRVLPMLNGTMTMPKGTGTSQAAYIGEAQSIGASKPSFGQVVATQRKLAAKVAISNDLLRSADPAVDAYVRDDMVSVMGLAEDAAFLRSAGSAYSPKGMRQFALDYKLSNPSSHNIITSTAAYTLATVSAELGGAITKLELKNVPEIKRVWIMNPRSKNYLLNIQNALGVYVFRDEMLKGTLFGFPFYTTTQIPLNLTDASSNGDCSEVYFVDVGHMMILDARMMELMTSQEASFVDDDGVTKSAFDSDMTVIRAITAHDFQTRYDEAIAIIDKVRWAPTLT